jgi:hypothetical protein
LAASLNAAMATDEALLSLEAFQQPDFNIASLVSGLTDGLVKKSREEGGGKQTAAVYACGTVNVTVSALFH